MLGRGCNLGGQRLYSVQRVLMGNFGAGYQAVCEGVPVGQGQHMNITSIDHIVLTVEDIERTVSFYRDVLGMEKEEFGEGRIALVFGGQKINLHQAGAEFEPKADRPMPGSADICFLTEWPVVDWSDKLRREGIDVIEGPVDRTGARGPIYSIYLRDPDGNLVEISNRKQ